MESTPAPQAMPPAFGLQACRDEGKGSSPPIQQEGTGLSLAAVRENPRRAKKSRRFIVASWFWTLCKMSACQGSRDRAKATTAINAAVAPGALAIAQVGLRAFGPRSKSAISLLRGDSAVAL